MDYIITGPNDYGHIKIAIILDDNECAHILFKIQADMISISMIYCSCPPLKGKCMKHLFKKMIEYITEHHRGNIDHMNVELFVSPEYQEGVREETAIAKLKTHYRKYGFENDPSSADLTEYMITTIGHIKSRSPMTKKTRGGNPGMSPSKTRKVRVVGGQKFN